MIPTPAWAVGPEFTGWRPLRLFEQGKKTEHVFMGIAAADWQWFIVDESGSVYSLFEGHMDGRYAFDLYDPVVAANVVNLIVAKVLVQQAGLGS